MITRRTLSYLLTVYISLIGCSSSYTVSSSPDADQSFSQFDAGPKRWKAVVQFQDGRIVNVQEVIAGPDSISFQDIMTGVRTCVSTHEIKNIDYPGRGTVAWKSAAIGFAAGAVAVVWVLASREEPGRTMIPLGYFYYSILGLAGGCVGWFAGFGIGELIPHTDEHTFERRSL